MPRLTRRPASSRRILTGLMAIGVAASAALTGATQRDAQDGTTADGGPMLASAVQPVSPAVPIATAFDPGGVALGVSVVESGFRSPVLVTHAGDGSGRLFVVEQTGKVKIVAGGNTLPTPFIDLSSAVAQGGEQGLLGLAFNPLYPARPYIYVNFTDRRGNTVINRYTVSSNPNVINRSSGVRILTISRPFTNHNGGHMAFGPDGLLYIGTGDGGGAGDPGNRAQSLGSLLGKMLRIDVNQGSTRGHYAIPSSNPYVGKSGLDEIWSRGLRNPWRWSFDRATGQLWIADVGQDRWEEVNRSSPSATVRAGRGLNYGWAVLEGRACFKPSSGCSTSGKQGPQTVYGHAVSGDDNCSVTGGYVYRGADYPALAGGYVFGDFCSGRIWVMSPTAIAPVTATLVRDSNVSPHISVSSFGEDEAGELYVCDLGGTVYQVTATTKP